MVAIYVRWINNGKMNLTDVPEHWRAEVAAKLGIDADA